MKDTLESVRQLWEHHAKRDPLWAILSYDAKRDGKWDTTRFFETGANEIAAMLGELDVQGIVTNRGSALDFGCGVGRLTQALGPHFERVVGVDISREMCNLAAQFNRFPKTLSISATTPDLRVLPDDSFDFIVSSSVLQHLQPVRVGSVQDSDTSADLDGGSYARCRRVNCLHWSQSSARIQADDSETFPMFGVRLSSVVRLIAD